MDTLDQSTILNNISDVIQKTEMHCRSFAGNCAQTKCSNRNTTDKGRNIGGMDIGISTWIWIKHNQRN